MSADTPGPSQEPSFAPDDVSGRTFPTAFRGFDPVEVRSFLGQIADQLRALVAREDELRRTVEELRAAQVEAENAAAAAADAAAAAEPPTQDSSAVLDEARAEAEQIVAAARQEADGLLRDAKERVAQLGHAATAESQRVLEEAKVKAQQAVRAKVDEVEGSAVKKLADAEREAAAIRVKAREDADAILEAAKERGREMVSEAQAARERLIADITKRKRAAATQLDQLRTGRDRLLEALRVVRRNLDEVTMRLEATEGSAPPSAAAPESPALGGGGGAGDAGDAGGAPATSPSGAAQNGDHANGDVAPPGSPRARRPARGSRVMLGEPPQPATHPAVASSPSPAAGPNVISVSSQPGPRIDAPQARTSAEPAPETTDVGDIIATPAPATETQLPERRSSALRILRRNRGAARETAASPPVGRELAGEGVRIIKPPAPEVSPAPDAEAERATEPEPVAENAAPSVDVESEAEVEEADVGAYEQQTDVVDAEASSEAVADEGAADVDTDAGTVDVDVDVDAVAVGEVAPEDLPPPLAPEEVRPRIEDLFARIRADREQAVAKAREVLADGGDDEGAADADTSESPGAAEASEEPSAAAQDGDEHLLQARDVVLDPMVGQLTRRLKRSIQDEQNATLDRLRTAKPRPGADDVLANPETQPAPYRYAAAPLLEEAARAAATAAPFGTVAVGVDDLAQALATELCDQIRAKVDRVLADAAQDDVDVQTASERVSSVYREWKTQKVERVATHYLVAAWSRGTFVGTPEGTPMRWVIDDDGPCPDCEDNALAGPTPRGHAYPTGQLHPPAHPGCRCLLASAQG